MKYNFDGTPQYCEGCISIIPQNGKKSKFQDRGFQKMKPEDIRRLPYNNT